MSWRDTLSEAQARLTALEAAELKIITGQQVAEVAFNGGSTKFAKGATLTDIRTLIGETRMVIANLSGSGPRRGGAIIPSFGG